MGVKGNGTAEVSAMERRRMLLLAATLLAALSVASRAEAQLPDAPSATEIAPLRRYSLTVGVEDTYSLTTSLMNLTPKMALSIRLGERETVGVSYSHATVVNDPHVQGNSVVAWLNFRVCSWGRIPKDR